MFEGKTMDMNTPEVAAALRSVRNILGRHGGSLELLEINPQGVALVRLDGACRGCAAQAATMRNIVEKVFKETAPQITQVEAIS
jgi:Fe-S cluster biogenesis protein NfuA